MKANYCSECGGKLYEKSLSNDNRPRLVCENCGQVLYVNPKVVTAAIPEHEGKVVLLRRGIEPRKGYWTYPSGYLEMGETVEEGAVRETKEETNFDARITRLLGLYSRPEVGVVVAVFLATVVGGEPEIGEETSEIRLFGPEEIPWKDLAFLSTEWALRDWVLSNANSESSLML